MLKLIKFINERCRGGSRNLLIVFIFFHGTLMYANDTLPGGKDPRNVSRNRAGA